MSLTFLIVRICGTALACYSAFQVYRAVSIGTVKTLGHTPTMAFVDTPAGFAFWFVGWLFGVAVGIFLFGYARWLANR
jgi:hypothetical protein